MFKVSIAVIFSIISIIQAGHLHAPHVLAQSSQVFARNYNGLAAPLIAAPAPLAYHNPYYHFRPSAPLVKSVAPLASIAPVTPFGLHPYGAAAALQYARFPGSYLAPGYF